MQLAIPAGSEDRARAFYVDALGFTEIRKPENLRARGGIWLRSGAKKAHPALRCSDYDALISTLQLSGVTVINDPDSFQGARHAYVDDPFGNRIELIDAPAP